MTVVRCEDERFVCIGDTPVLEYVFREADHRTVRSLTGKCAAWVTFSYPGAIPHLIRQARLMGTPRVVRYFCRGDEFNVFGQIRHQATVMYVDVAEGIDRSFHQEFHPMVTWNVIARPI